MQQLSYNCLAPHDIAEKRGTDDPSVCPGPGGGGQQREAQLGRRDCRGSCLKSLLDITDRLPGLAHYVRTAKVLQMEKSTKKKKASGQPPEVPKVTQSDGTWVSVFFPPLLQAFRKLSFHYNPREDSCFQNSRCGHAQLGLSSSMARRFLIDYPPA